MNTSSLMNNSSNNGAIADELVVAHQPSQLLMASITHNNSDPLTMDNVRSNDGLSIHPSQRSVADIEPVINMSTEWVTPTTVPSILDRITKAIGSSNEDYNSSRSNGHYNNNSNNSHKDNDKNTKNNGDNGHMDDVIMKHSEPTATTADTSNAQRDHSATISSTRAITTNKPRKSFFIHSIWLFFFRHLLPHRSPKHSFLARWTSCTIWVTTFTFRLNHLIRWHGSSRWWTRFSLTYLVCHLRWKSWKMGFVVGSLSRREGKRWREIGTGGRKKEKKSKGQRENESEAERNWKNEKSRKELYQFPINTKMNWQLEKKISLTFCNFNCRFGKWANGKHRHRHRRSNCNTINRQYAINMFALAIFLRYLIAMYM